MDKRSPNKIGERKTIGVLINSIDGFYQSPLWRGIKATAEERDINILFFAGSSLNSETVDDAQQNALYTLVNTEKVDGLILSSGSLLNYVGLNEFEKFLKPLKKIPIVSIAIDLKNIPSVVFDNKESMRMMVNHLIEHHKYTKIAFLKGPNSNPEAVLRYKGYREVLEEHNILFRRELVLQGNFINLTDLSSLSNLMENVESRPEVIVSANDEMAIKLYYNLEEMGYKVGKDIAITGLDDVEVVRGMTPAFTTIRQPIFEMASKACQIMCDLLEGHEVPNCVSLKGELIIRESCGCINVLKNNYGEAIVARIYTENTCDKDLKNLEKKFSEDKNNIIDLMKNEMGIKEKDDLKLSEEMTYILNTLVLDLRDGAVESRLIKNLYYLFNHLIIVKVKEYNWIEGIFALRNYILETINNKEVINKFNRIFYSVNTLLNNILVKKEAKDNFEFKRMYIGTRDIMQKFNSAITMDELVKVVIDAINWYGISQGYLCVYDKPINHKIGTEFELTEKVNLVLNYKNGKSFKGKKFNTKDILPKEILNGSERKDLIFYSLFVGEVHFGYIAWDLLGINEYIFETFRQQISNTLKIQMLFNERIKAEEELNIAVKELEKLNGELKSIYVIDELTGLYNRRGFFIHGENLYKSAAITGGKIILFFGDLDGLKKINDSYGHKEGDEAIAATGLILKRSFQADDIVARMGGDEFTMIAANKSSIEEIQLIIDKINNNFNLYNKVSKKHYKLSISIGFSVYVPSNKLSFEALIQNADKKLYEQKRWKKINSKQSNVFEFLGDK